MVKFNIIDNGPGIKKEDQERVFQIFETTSNTLRTGEKGTGIGLATVKSLIEGLGGTITLSSEFGKGTNFEFTIKK
jgi:signal transduction histidine kinase